MNKVALFVTVAAAGLSLLVADANAQRNFVERPGASIGLRRAGDWRAANSLRHLNDELRHAQYEAQRVRGEGRRIRHHLVRIARITDRLNYDYNRRRVRAPIIHRRAEQLRAEVRSIRGQLRRRGGWRIW